MALFDFWKFGSKAEEAKARDAARKAVVGLDIDMAIAAHENWKQRLLVYLDGQSSEDLRAEVICADDRCDLGKWIHGEGARQLGEFASFNELRSTHKLFHYTASNVVALQSTGKTGEAQALLTGEYSKISSRIVGRLRDLKALARS
jgi:hypothetical protein